MKKPGISRAFSSVLGHAPDQWDEFTSIEEVAGLVEDALIAANHAELEILYGLSMGGGIALYELPHVIMRLILARDFLLTELGKHSKRILSLVFPVKEYAQDSVNRMFTVLRAMSARTIWRDYASTDNYSMTDVFPALETQIEY